MTDAGQPMNTPVSPPINPPVTQVVAQPIKPVFPPLPEEISPAVSVEDVLKQVDLGYMRTVCTHVLTDKTSLKDFPIPEAWEPYTVLWTNNLGREYLFMDNGMPVLGVAHLDTVLKDNHFHGPLEIRGHPVILNPNLDDRWGAYILLDLLPKLGLAQPDGRPLYDILLVRDEEKSSSTARIFVPPEDREYNWLFEFDRAGDDVVFYQYESEPLRNLYKRYGFKPATGSYSDIAELGDLEISAANIACGYYGQHTLMGYGCLDVMAEQVGKFVPLFQDVQNIRLPNLGRKSRYPVYNNTQYYGNNGYNNGHGGGTSTGTNTNNGTNGTSDGTGTTNAITVYSGGERYTEYIGESSTGNGYRVYFSSTPGVSAANGTYKGHLCPTCDTPHFTLYRLGKSDLWICWQCNQAVMDELNHTDITLEEIVQREQGVIEAAKQLEQQQQAATQPIPEPSYLEACNMCRKQVPVDDLVVISSFMTLCPECAEAYAARWYED